LDVTTTLRQIRQFLLSAAIALLAVVCVQPLAGAAPVRISGTTGKAAQHASINFKGIAREEAWGPMPLSEHRTIHRPVAPPTDGALQRGDGLGAPPRAAGQEQALPSPEASAQSPAPLSSFEALGDNDTVIPPDTDGAVGPNNLMVAVNSQVAIQDRAGTTLSTVAITGFWSSLGVPDAFDPRVIYDPYGQRWIFSAASGENSASAAILIGVSQGIDPTAGWNLYRVPVDPSGADWGDYPTLGFNKKWIVVQANLFTVSGDAFDKSVIWAFDKADLYAGGTGKYTRLQPSSGFTQLPATTYDSNLGTMYLLESRSGGLAKLRLDTITGAVGAEVLTTAVAFPIGSAAWQSFSPTVNFAPQLGSARLIDTDDDRLQSCVYRNGSLWASQTVYLPATGTPTRTAAQWWQISTAVGSVGQMLQFGRISDPSGANFYAYPTLAVNQNNDVMMGYTHFGPGLYPSAGYSTRLATDALNTMEAGVTLKAGEAPYFKDFGTGDNRWGDFSATVVDPVDDTAMWTIQEYAGQGNMWGLWWGEVNTQASSATPTPSPGATPTPVGTTTPTPTPTATPTPLPLEIGAPAKLPNAHTTVFYRVSLGISGGRAPYRIAVVRGHLPPGLWIGHAAGVIRGVATTQGTWYPTIRVIDAVGNRARKRFRLTVWQVTRAYCKRTLLCQWSAGHVTNRHN
jgi:Putative Ig domain